MTQEYIEILLVEDSPTDARLFEEILADPFRHFDFRFNLRVVGKLSEALSLSGKADPFNVVFLDLGLPDSSGLDTLAKAVLSFSGIPIIVLTGSDDIRLGVEAVRLGAQDYISKNDIKQSTVIRAIFHARERINLERSLRRKCEETERIDKFLMDREKKILELKKEVDSHLKSSGKPPKYGV